MNLNDSSGRNPRAVVGERHSIFGLVAIAVFTNAWIKVHRLFKETHMTNVLVYLKNVVKTPKPKEIVDAIKLIGKTIEIKPMKNELRLAEEKVEWTLARLEAAELAQGMSFEAYKAAGKKFDEATETRFQAFLEHKTATQALGALTSGK
jgi:hypothetical protein